MSNNNDNVKIGSSYYSVLDVLKNKILQNILEVKSDSNLDEAQISKLSFIIGAEIESAKSWGYDQIKLK